MENHNSKAIECYGATPAQHIGMEIQHCNRMQCHLLMVLKSSHVELLQNLLGRASRRCLDASQHRVLSLKGQGTPVGQWSSCLPDFVQVRQHVGVVLAVFWSEKLFPQLVDLQQGRPHVHDCLVLFVIQAKGPDAVGQEAPDVVQLLQGRNVRQLSI